MVSKTPRRPVVCGWLIGFRRRRTTRSSVSLLTGSLLRRAPAQGKSKMVDDVIEPSGSACPRRSTSLSKCSAKIRRLQSTASQRNRRTLTIRCTNLPAGGKSAKRR